VSDQSDAAQDNDPAYEPEAEVSDLAEDALAYCFPYGAGTKGEYIRDLPAADVRALTTALKDAERVIEIKEDQIRLLAGYAEREREQLGHSERILAERCNNLERALRGAYRRIRTLEEGVEALQEPAQGAESQPEEQDEPDPATPNSAFGI
jgi:hypothetical protein